MDGGSSGWFHYDSVKKTKCSSIIHGENITEVCLFVWSRREVSALMPQLLSKRETGSQFDVPAEKKIVSFFKGESYFSLFKARPPPPHPPSTPTNSHTSHLLPTLLKRKEEGEAGA